MPASDGFVRAGVLGSFLAFAARYQGLSTERLLRGAGIDPASLGDPDTLLSSSAIIALYESAARESGDPCFGLAFATQIPWKDTGVIGYLMLHAPTVGDGLAAGVRCLAVQQTAGVGMLHDEGPRARLTYAVRDEAGPSAQHVDTILVVATRYCRDALADPRWAPLEIHTRRDAPPRDDDVRRYRDFFGCDVRFGAPDNAVVFDAADLARPAITSSPSLFPILQRHAEEVIARLPHADDVAADVRAAIAALLSNGDATIEAVAKKLALSTRTLQRKLREADVSFHDLLAQTRLGLARRYLADDGLSITDAALLLGYSDLTAFSRACRRWTGHSPQALRKVVATPMHAPPPPRSTRQRASVR